MHCLLDFGDTVEIVLTNVKWYSVGGSRGVDFRVEIADNYDPDDVRSVVSDSSRPMDCSLPGSSIHGIFQARVLEWGAMRWGGRGTQFSPRRQHVGLAFCNFSSLLQKWMIFILMVLGR